MLDSIQTLYLDAKKTTNKFDRRLKIVAILTHLVKRDFESLAVIVGGSAVAIYSEGMYATKDADLILSSYADVTAYMKLLNFDKIGKDYYNSELDILMEFPSGELAGSISKVVQFEVWDNYPVYIIGIEDLILDRVNSFVSTNDTSSKEWALRLMGALYVNLDWSYLHKTAHSQNVGKVVERFQRDVKRYKNNLNKLY